MAAILSIVETCRRLNIPIREDVSQTEGKDLPELSERVTGSVGEYRERLIDFIVAQSIELDSTKASLLLWG